MTIVTRIYIEHPDLALTPTIEAIDDATITVVAQTGTDPVHQTFPFLVQCHRWEEFETTLRKDHTVEQFKPVTAGDVERIYHISHTPTTKLLTPSTIEAGGLMVEAENYDAGWLVQLLLPNREALHSIWEFAREEGFVFDLIDVYEEGRSSYTNEINLTECQRETLALAYEEGYFEEPRRASLDELAEKLGISQSAVSGRLRRGIDRLVKATLFVDE